MQIILNALKDYKNMKRSLRARLNKYCNFRVKANLKNMLMIWMRALNIEMKTKLLNR